MSIRFGPFLLLGIVLTIPLSYSYGASIEEIQAKVAMLLQQIEALKNDISLPAAGSSIQGVVVLPVLNLTRTLSRGARGEDVRSLQQFLIPRGHLAADSATGYFGALTETAVNNINKQKELCRQERHKQLFLDS